MPSIARLGHVGLYCEDLERQRAFYQGVLGLTVTDEDPERGLVFLSARPDIEHHELLLAPGRNVGRDTRLVQQISFRCDELADVVGFLERFREHDVALDMVVSHGNAIGVYFFDPEGNRGEVYWATGLAARQPFVLGVDLSREPTVLMEEIAAQVARYGGEGVIDEGAFASQSTG